MKRFLLAVIGMSILSGCAGPRYAAMPIQADTDKSEVVIINDRETRVGFQKTMEAWLVRNNYSFTVAPDGSKHDLDKLTLEYIGKWGWDGALYLKDAEIKAYQNGQRVGEVTFRVPYTANLNKFGNGAKRIGIMMDALFGHITAEGATRKVN